MITTTVKGIPEELYTKLKKQAEENMRSINKEIITLIKRGVK